jgi:hypothetical protein
VRRANLKAKALVKKLAAKKEASKKTKGKKEGQKEGKKAKGKAKAKGGGEDEEAAAAEEDAAAAEEEAVAIEAEYKEGLISASQEKREEILALAEVQHVVEIMSRIPRNIPIPSTPPMAADFMIGSTASLSQLEMGIVVLASILALDGSKPPGDACHHFEWKGAANGDGSGGIGSSDGDGNGSGGGGDSSTAGSTAVLTHLRIVVQRTSTPAANYKDSHTSARMMRAAWNGYGEHDNETNQGPPTVGPWGCAGAGWTTRFGRNFMTGQRTPGTEARDYQPYELARDDAAQNTEWGKTPVALYITGGLTDIPTAKRQAAFQTVECMDTNTDGVYWAHHANPAQMVSPTGQCRAHSYFRFRAGGRVPLAQTYADAISAAQKVHGVDNTNSLPVICSTRPDRSINLRVVAAFLHSPVLWIFLGDSNCSGQRRLDWKKLRGCGKTMLEWVSRSTACVHLRYLCGV